MAPFRRIKSPVEARIDGGRVHVVAMKKFPCRCSFNNQSKSTPGTQKEKKGGCPTF